MAVNRCLSEKVWVCFAALNGVRCLQVIEVWDGVRWVSQELTGRSVGFVFCCRRKDLAVYGNQKDFMRKSVGNQTRSLFQRLLPKSL